MVEEKLPKQRKIDDKISIFGILGASKAVTNPLKEMLALDKQRLATEQERLAVEKQQVEMLGKIEDKLAKSADMQKALSQIIARIAYAQEEHNHIIRRKG